MENIALFNDTEVNEVTAYAAAQVIVSGLTATEKKLSVVKQASSSAVMFMASQNGKVGKAARENIGALGEYAIAKQARNGNYKPMCDVIASLTGESLTVSSRAAYECLVDRFEDALRDLKNGGYTTDKKTGMDKPTPKRKVLMQVIGLLAEVQAIAASL